MPGYGEDTCASSSVFRFHDGLQSARPACAMAKQIIVNVSGDVRLLDPCEELSEPIDPFTNLGNVCGGVSDFDGSHNRFLSSSRCSNS